MHKGYKFMGGAMLALMLIMQPAHAGSRLFKESHPTEDAANDTGFKYPFANALEPYLQGSIVIRQKLYEHLLQSEDFIRMQSMVRYLWVQRSK